MLHKQLNNTIKRLATATVVIGLTFSAQAVDFDKGQWLDLTHEFNEKSIYWPTAEPFKKTEVFAKYFSFFIVVN